MLRIGCIYIERDTDGVEFTKQMLTAGGIISSEKIVSNSKLRYKMMFAAYNAGPGNLNKARRKSDKPENWENINRHLPEETRNYIPTIYDKYGIYKQWAVLKPY